MVFCGFNNMKVVNLVTLILLVIGGLNWGLVGIAGVDIVMTILGAGIISQIVYILVGLSAIYVAVMAAMGKQSPSQPMM